MNTLNNLETFLFEKIKEETHLAEFVHKFSILIQDSDKGQYNNRNLYIVGGYPRDLVISFFYGTLRDKRDVDLALTGFSDNDLEELKEILEKCRKEGLIRNFHHVSADFPVIKIYVDTLETAIDLALARGYEISTGTGHRDFTFKTEQITIEDDLARRDFTLNAIALRIFQDNNTMKIKLVDEFNGIEAIKEKQIATVGDPEQRFFEDPIRQIRAIRFAAQLQNLNFQIESRTLETISLTFPKTYHSIPAEPLIEEVGRSFLEDFSLTCLLFKKTGIMSFILTFMKSMGTENALFIDNIITSLKKDLNSKTVWLPVFFVLARAEAETILKNHGGIIQNKDLQLPSTLQLIKCLRFSNKTGEYIQKLILFYYHSYLSCPMAQLDHLWMWTQSKPERKILWMLYTKITEAEKGDSHKITSEINLIRTTPLPYSKEDLIDFFETHEIESRPIRSEMLTHAREMQLIKHHSDKESFLKDALSFYDRKYNLLKD